MSLDFGTLKYLGLLQFHLVRVTTFKKINLAFVHKIDYNGFKTIKPTRKRQETQILDLTCH